MNPSSYLSDAEREKLSAFNADEVLVGAVRKVFLAGIYYNGTLKPSEKAEPSMNFVLNFDLEAVDNAQFGQEMRGKIEGIRTLETGFAEIARIADTPIDKSAPTPKKKPRSL